MAEEVGRLLARRGAVVFTGGKKGIMEAASRGAALEGGLVVAVLPENDVKGSNAYASLVLASGMGFARGQILTNSVDGAILIEGGIGTYGEAAMMYYLKKPTVALLPSGGVAAELAGKVLDRRGHPPILSAKDAREAVDLVLGGVN